jgi:hypothetical protein
MYSYKYTSLSQCSGVALLCMMLSVYLLNLDWEALAVATHAAALAGEAELDEREVSLSLSRARALSHTYVYIYIYPVTHRHSSTRRCRATLSLSLYIYTHTYTHTHTHTQAQFYALLESNCTLLEKGEVCKDEVELAEVFFFFSVLVPLYIFNSFLFFF